MYQILVFCLISCTFGKTLTQQVVNSAPESPVAQYLGLSAGATQVVPNLKASFSCVGRRGGYYADVDNDCRIFHVCHPSTTAEGEPVIYQYSKFCPNSTRFDQRALTCLSVNDPNLTQCRESSRYFHLTEIRVSGAKTVATPEIQNLAVEQRVEQEVEEHRAEQLPVKGIPLTNVVNVVRSEPLPQPLKSVVQPVVEQRVEQRVEQSVPEPVQQTVYNTVPQVVSQPIVEQRVEQSVPEPFQQTVYNTVPQVISQPIVEQRVEQKVEQSVPEPVQQTVYNTVPQVISQPIVEQRVEQFVPEPIQQTAYNTVPLPVPEQRVDQLNAEPIQQLAYNNQPIEQQREEPVVQTYAVQPEVAQPNVQQPLTEVRNVEPIQQQPITYALKQNTVTANVGAPVPPVPQIQNTVASVAGPVPVSQSQAVPNARYVVPQTAPIVYIPQPSVQTSTAFTGPRVIRPSSQVPEQRSAPVSGPVYYTTRYSTVPQPVFVPQYLRSAQPAVLRQVPRTVYTQV